MRGARNDGATIAGFQDAAVLCRGRGRNPPPLGSASSLIVVGSYAPATLEMSSFTNRGACVDVFAPGEGILTAGFDGALFPSDGTSYATPLVTRWLALTSAHSASPANLRRRARGGRPDADGRRMDLPVSELPPEVLWGVGR